MADNKFSVIHGQNLCFVQEILADSVTLPVALLTDYAEMGLTAEELVILLRLWAVYMRRQQLELADVAAEFKCGEEEAMALLRPYIDKELLLADEEQEECYSFAGLFNILFDNWMFVKSCSALAKEEEVEDKVIAAKKEQVRELSHLYTVFEKELGRILSPLESDQIRKWRDEEHMPAATIEEALRRAVLQDKAGFAYIAKIIRNWQKQQLYSLEDIVTAEELAAVCRDNRKGAPARSKKTEAESKPLSKYEEMIYEKMLRS